ncbi:MAG: SDR family oxidoreductase [Dehalococcoidia bacterium]
MAALTGRNIVVTGSGRGIGQAVAKSLAAHGANVVVNDPGVNVDGSGSDQGPAGETVAAITAAGGTAVANYDSIATVEGGENLIKQCVDTWGRIDGVVHVAGILRDRMVFNMTKEEWDAVIAVHLDGYFNVAKPASILMRQQRFGRIIGFSSGSGLNGNAGQANYGAAKAAIAGMGKCLARDLGRYGITANTIAPGANTRMTQSIPESATQLRARAGIAVQARAVTDLRGPDVVAPVITYLCTDQAWNINGKIFHVSGGNVAIGHEEAPLRTITSVGMWTIDQLREKVPTLMAGLANPAPPAPDIDVPGRGVVAR